LRRDAELSRDRSRERARQLRDDVAERSPLIELRLTARVSAAAAGEAAVMVDGAAVPSAAERAASESPS
jgi:hypothetical protein